jgi:hypothetical protein
LSHGGIILRGALQAVSGKAKEIVKDQLAVVGHRATVLWYKGSKWPQGGWRLNDWFTVNYKGFYQNFFW